MKTLPRFFLTKNEIKREKFVMVDKELAHKLRHVLRLNKGDLVTVIDEEGTEYVSKLEIISSEKIVGSFVSINLKTENKKPVIVLAQALPKAGKIDEIVKDNTQIGVDGFIFFESEFGVVKLDKVKDNKLERLERLAVESARQSGRNSIPSIEKLMTFEEVITLDFCKKLLMNPKEIEGSQDIKDIKSTISAEDRVLILIGPEGGFSPKEIKSAIKENCEIVYIDLPILRTELAGVITLGILFS